MDTRDSGRGAWRLIQAVQDLSQATDLDRVREIVRSAARQMVGADGATFVLRDGDRCHYVDEDAIGPLWRGQRFPMSACISGWAMLHRQPAVVPDIFQDPRIPVDAYQPTFVRSLVMVPIRETDPIGAIGTYWAATHDAEPETVALLQALANTTAVALENLRVHHELEQRVRERTMQLEAANQELDAFSYSVSHDLRAPLRRIGGFAEMLRDDCDQVLTAQGQHALNRITSSVEHMSQLIDDLLAFARLGRRSLSTRPVNLADLVREAQQEAMADVVNRHIDWQVRVPAVVLGDPALIRHALVNLLSNAVKYTRHRTTARIEVGVMPDSSPDELEAGEVVVYVRDNGAGFDPKYAGRLFGVFQRLHSSDEFEGTGIGLASVRRIIARHGGRTWAEGALDQGATFCFTLPRAA